MVLVHKGQGQSLTDIKTHSHRAKAKKFFGVCPLFFDLFFLFFYPFRFNLAWFWYE